MTQRLEIVARADTPAEGELAPGVELRTFASGAKGARELATCLVTFRPGAQLPYHTHPFSEVITALGGESQVLVEGRRYRIGPFDAIHIPAGVAHTSINPSSESPARLLAAFASETPTSDPAERTFPVVDRQGTDASLPEHLMRFDEAPVYELAARARFRDLFASRFGTRGLCGGYGVFEPGASLPCHIHGFDESITIVEGTAICQVAGREYELSGFDTACVPRGRPHRFINRSTAPMAMVWIYAGDEPDRTLVDPGYCEGLIPFEADGLKLG